MVLPMRLVLIFRRSNQNRCNKTCNAPACKQDGGRNSQYRCRSDTFSMFTVDIHIHISNACAVYKR